ncbi:winged helix-turn-helix domain-containing protein [Thiovibrio sp. JS02]
MKQDDSEKKNGARGVLRWRGRLWLEGPEGTFLGYGRVVLLERIAQYGSIARAARSMEMSYKHAWDLLDSMNRQAGCRLVETSRGGKRGGGARLTPDGEAAIAMFRKYYGRFEEVLVEMGNALQAELPGLGHSSHGGSEE